MKNVSLYIDNVKLNFRVAIIPYHDGKAMLEKIDRNDFFILLGGRVQIGEDTKSAIVREMEEEIGAVVDEEKLELVYVCENFFIFDEKKVHELIFIYKYDIGNFNNYKDFHPKKYDDITIQWKDISSFPHLSIKPKIVKSFTLETKLTHSSEHNKNY